MNREPVDYTTDTWYVCLLLISVELACFGKGEGRGGTGREGERTEVTVTFPSSCAWSPSFPHPHPPSDALHKLMHSFSHNFVYSDGFLSLLSQERWSYYLCHVSVGIIIIIMLYSPFPLSVVTKRFLFGIFEYID